MEYEEREKLKAEGWKIFSEVKEPYAKRNALMQFIIKAHYWRAREEIESRKDCNSCLRKIFPKKYSPGYEMDIDHYTEHWLYANKDQEFMKDGVFECCVEWYTPISSKYLPNGATVYQI